MIWKLWIRAHRLTVIRSPGLAVYVAQQGDSYTCCWSLLLLLLLAGMLTSAENPPSAMSAAVKGDL